MEMNWPLFFMGAAAAGFINGLAGFGTALFALGLWLQFMAPIQAVAIILVLAVATGLQGLWVVRHDIIREKSRVARFVLPGLCGIPLGLAMLKILDAQTLKTVIAAFLLLYGGYFSMRRNLPNIAHPHRAVDLLIGFAGGVLGGAAGLSGALPTMWLSMRDWAKSQTRAVLQPFNISVLAVSAILLALQGSYDRFTLVLIAAALPVSLGFAMIGIKTYGLLNDRQFRRLLIVMTLLSGIAIIVGELF